MYFKRVKDWSQIKQGLGHVYTKALKEAENARHTSTTQSLENVYLFYELANRIYLYDHTVCRICFAPVTLLFFIIIVHFSRRTN